MEVFLDGVLLGNAIVNGTTWTYDLSANVTWTLPVPDVDLKLRFSVFNLLNEQEVINVSQRYEAQPGQVRPTWGTGTRWQSPRYMQLVMTYNF